MAPYEWPETHSTFYEDNLVIYVFLVTIYMQYNISNTFRLDLP